MSEDLKTEVIPAEIISNEDIKKDLENPEEKTRSSFFETFAFLLFSVSFVVIAFLIFANPDHSAVNSGINKELNAFRYQISSIKNKLEFFNWTKEMLFYTCYTYSEKAENKTIFQLAHTNNIVSDIRLIQRRMQLKEGNSPFWNKTWKVWKGKGFKANSPRVQMKMSVA
eukprot:TRINITY_DN3142_c0_g14_i1.p2 TRINITY_DN3142_c0_g14~~TRINITY_DN3142_c0_g14_i1.p2  ORF type:complete len:169 (+),score=34.84 TRINITY_DN3142_c0_g14_i1:156-662(+)